MAQDKKFVADPDVFLQKLADAMAAAGMNAKFTGVHLQVGDFRFDAERGRPDDVIRFLNSGFKVERAGDFDIARATGLVIAELPKKIKEKESRERQVKYATTVRGITGDARLPVSDDRFKNWFHVSEHISLSYSDKGMELKVTTDDVTVLEEVLEGVKDYFLSHAPLRVPEEVPSGDAEPNP